VDEEPNTTPWSVEEIPDKDFLFMRVHIINVRDDIPTPGAFKNHGDGMSTDWSKYSTAQETLRRAKHSSKNGVIKMIVGEVRGLSGQRVEHTPIATNQAHTDIFGEKDEEIRIKFRRICRLVIPLAPQ